MKTQKISVFALVVAGLFASPLMAQIPGTNIPPRPDDHFQRNLVVNRIDLGEKINKPLISTTDGGLYGNSRYPETNGLIAALMNGLKSGKYLAYDPDNLTKSLTYEDVMAKDQSKHETPDFEDPIDPEFPEDDPMWMEEDQDVMVDETGANAEGQGTFAQSGSGQATEGDFSLAPYESVIEFIENRIFDKNRSAEIFDIQYIRLVWVDPGETLPDENFICLKFSDVLETLEATQWKNAFNDAEDRNMREIFEERIFSGFVTNVSGRGVRTLAEADFRRNEMLNFEHHLWSY
ncbi:MAG: hypothetical protein IPP17_08280 [Bacteroidetes bacterium]|nr:hypothetical protein [Bacteroidota bacterium]